MKVGPGTTVSGIKCKPGVHQFDSPYAPPCIAKFTGNNGGATYRGVTSNEIVLATREFPTTANSQQIASRGRGGRRGPPPGHRPGRSRSS